MTNKLNIKDLSWEDLNTLTQQLELPKFRAEQIWRGLYQHLAISSEEMKLIPKVQRDLLDKNYRFNSFQSYKKFVSIDGSVKFLFELWDGEKVEAVYMPWHDEEGKLERATICVSSQIGCGLDCKFCATGTMGLTRNLKASEIIDQIITCEKDLGITLTNIVFMGMGEPLLNFNNVMKSIENLSGGPFKKFRRKRITVSTSGVIPGIRKLAELQPPVKLALSLHATTNGARDKIIPLNQKSGGLNPLLLEIEKYYRKTKMPLTYEYIPFKGLNDTEQDAKRLAKIAKRVPSRVNLIPFNDISFTEPTGISASLRPVDDKKMNEFVNQIKSFGGVAIVRDTFGSDIDAACGQLALSEKESTENE
ncbi:23S rRNA (adenine(2503)-C(2))-methyltransferase RlmN [Candidatus Kapabacteria bacterium]|nr:23S rRNA (adenine(2503)-C(2))-methyltransferase RlmN [Candidatus Kapabacteria bacterium]